CRLLRRPGGNRRQHLQAGHGDNEPDEGFAAEGRHGACQWLRKEKSRLRLSDLEMLSRKRLWLIAPQSKPKLAQLFAHLGQRRHAEILRLQQFVGGSVAKFAKGV